MKAYVCKVCGYIHFGEEAPERCPQCGAGKEAFVERQESEGAKQYADEHRIGVAQGLDEEIVKGLNKIADYCYKNLRKKNTIIIEGSLNSKSEGIIEKLEILS